VETRPAGARNGGCGGGESNIRDEVLTLGALCNLHVQTDKATGIICPWKEVQGKRCVCLWNG
jgi:hypothetical protein